ncbi:MAG TPA: alpha/beta hydrolase [Cyclobacteriaceae bacterium]|nr:alpha/beta hydrolase [Cyclobacteriaceae bacterium]
MKYIIWMIFMLYSLPTVAQFDPITISLYTTVPNVKVSDEKESIATEDIALVRNVQEPNIQVFLPSKRNATGQAVVICPGGGYAVLAYDWEGTDIAKWFNSHGIAAIVLKYRLPSLASQEAPHEAPLMDAQRAMRMVRQHAKEWNIDPQQIGVMGFSAGGHLASTLGTHYDAGDGNAEDPIEQISSRPDFMILGYPVISLKKHVAHIGSRNNLLGKSPSDDLVDKFSNELHVTEDTPPTFIFHSQDDTGVPVQHSLLFYDALLDAKVPVEMHLYPTGGHGYSLGINAEGTHKGWPETCINWMRGLTR